MKKLLLLVVFAIFAELIFANSGCYWVFFKDKANTEFNPYEYFDKKAIERRQKLGLSLYDVTDYPLNTEYVTEVSVLSEEFVGESRWFNAVGIMATDENIAKIKQLPFVESVVEIAGEAVVAEYLSKNYSNENYDSFDENMLNPELSMQLQRMQGELFAEKNIDGKGVRIAVFDGGFPNVDKHKAFSHLRDNNQIVKTWNFPNKKENVYNWSSHGTMTLSCIAGVYQDNNSVVKLGLATGAEFLLARTEVEPEPFKEEIWWAMAMEWADKNGADIISSSLGYGKDRYNTSDMNGTSYVAKAANMAARKGMLVCNSMGNEADDSSWRVLITPADADSVLAIGGIENSLDEYRHIGFSSYGPTADYRRKPNVCAFGCADVADKKVDEFTSAYGTSFSCPLVAGFAACALQTNPELTAMQLMAEIEKSGDLYPYFDYAFGYGVPQAEYFTNGEKTKVEPTFKFVYDEKSSSLNIELDEFNNKKEVFYNIMTADGYLLAFEHISPENLSTITIPDVDMYSGCSVNVYYHGYVGTYSLDFDNNTEYYPGYKGADVEYNNLDLRRTHGNVIANYHERKRFYGLFQINAGVAGVKTYEKKTNSYKSAFGVSAGFLFEACKKYRLGVAIGIGFDDYWGHELSGTSYENLISEKFRVPNVNLEILQRVKLARGGLFSNGLNWDLGVYGGLNFSNKYIVKLDSQSPEFSSTRMINKNYKFINDYQWGVKTAITYDIISVYAKLRISDLLDESYTGVYDDFMKLEIGLQLILPF